MKKKLYKIEEGKILSGVCGGIAEYLNINKALVRLIWLILTSFFGFGIILYIILEIKLPTKKEATIIEVEKVEENKKENK